MFNFGYIIKTHMPIYGDLSKEDRKNREEFNACMDQNTKLMFSVFHSHSIQAVAYQNPSREALWSILDKAEQWAEEDSYTYFYFTCPGRENGLELCQKNIVELESISYQELRQKMDRIRGTKILILEASHSGAAISPALGGAFCGPDYHVLVADQNCVGNLWTKDGGAMTRKWAAALGIDPDTGNLLKWKDWDPKQVDLDRDMKFSLLELCAATESTGKFREFQDGCWPPADILPVFAYDPLYRPGRPRPTMKNRGFVLAANMGETYWATELHHKYLRDILVRATSAKEMAHCFSMHQIVPTVRRNEEWKHIKAEILSYAEREADENTYTYFYFCCRGTRTGLHLDYHRNDGDLKHGWKVNDVSYQEIFDTLNQIPGEKILLIDADYSGAAIAENFGPLRKPGFHVLTSCGPEEFCIEPEPEADYSRMTRFWCEALEKVEKTQIRLADRDKDGFVSLGDLAQHTRDTSLPWNPEVTLTQKDQCWPSNDILPVFSDGPMSSAFFERNGRGILWHYGQHREHYGRKIGKIEEIDPVWYLPCQNGVIVQHGKNDVEGFQNLTLTLDEVFQKAYVGDGQVDQDLELSLEVHLRINGQEAEYQKRFPEGQPHGGSRFQVLHADGSPVQYSLGRITSETVVELELVLWDYDSGGRSDVLQRYPIRLDVRNGWGTMIPVVPCEQFRRSDEGIFYTEAWTETKKVVVSFHLSHF